MKTSPSPSLFARRLFVPFLLTLAAACGTAAGQEIDVDVSKGNSPFPITTNLTYQFVDVGETGVGVVNHSAGNLTVTSTLTLGNQTGSNGTYNLTGGNITSVLEFVGNNGSGAFVQSGTSTNAVSNFLGIGSTGGTSTYTLNAGLLIVNNGTTAASESIGQVGAATFTQAGGQHTVNPLGTFTLGDDAAGTYNLNGGTLTISKLTRGTGTGTFNFNGGTLQANAATTTFFQGLTVANVQAGGARLDSGNFAITVAQNLTADATSAGGGLTKLGAGTLTLTGANTYTGGTTFAAGSLNVGSANAIGTAGTLSFTGGTLQYSAANTTDYSARFSQAANQVYSVDTNGQNVAYATGLNSTGGSLNKLGTGTLTLNATSAFTGSTTVSGGTLTVNNNATTSLGRLSATSDVNIKSGGTLALAGSAAITDRINNAATFTLNGGGTFVTGALTEGAVPALGGVGGLAGVGTLTLTGTTNASRATIDFGNTQTGSALVFSSLAAGGKGSFVNILGFTGTALADNGLPTNDRLLFATDPGFTRADLANWQFFNDAGTGYTTGGVEILFNGYFEIVPVPEPATTALMLASATLLGVGAWRRGKRKILA